jgi:hypothetical protein
MFLEDIIPQPHNPNFPLPPPFPPGLAQNYPETGKAHGFISIDGQKSDHKAGIIFRAPGTSGVLRGP